MADLWRRTSGSSKGAIQTVDRQDKGPPKKFGDLDKSRKKLEGIPETVLEKFEDLFKRSSELFFECSQFSKRDISEPFPQLESDAIALAKRKNVVESTIHELFQEYTKQEFPKHYPRAIALKRESRLIIERAQRSIDNCRPLVDEVRQKRKPSEESVDIEDSDLGSDIENPFDKE